MKKIKIKSLSLVNFKGIRSFEADLDKQTVEVAGGNATGKTTLYDAYLWLLFGKDSAGRSDGNGGFNVKTLGEDGKPIRRLEHSVTAVLEVDGRAIKLQRSLVEKWQKVNGTTDEVMKDETQYFVNDVRCGTKKEYQAEISDIIPEDVFRMVTNPYHFTALPADTQKDMLLELAGNISDEDVARLNDEFLALLDSVSGTSLVKYAKEVAMKKRACNDALMTIPASIETAQKLMPDAEDWKALQGELEAKQKRVAQIDAQIADKTACNDAEYRRKATIKRNINTKRMALQDRENAIRMEANAERNKAVAAISDMEGILATAQSTAKRLRATLADTQAQAQELEKKVVALREDFKAVAMERYDASGEDALICPTCHEPLRGENKEKAVATIRGNFEQSKAKRQKDIQAKGVALRTQLDAKKADITTLTGQIAANEDKVLELKGELEVRKAHIPTAANADELTAKDDVVKGLLNDIAELENQLSVEVKTADTGELQEAKAQLTYNIAELNQRLANRTQIERVKKEIADLEEKRIANNQALADCERWEDTYQRFQKAKDEELMRRINGLFKVVSFSFVKEQKNGGEKITCYCMVNGVPYPDVNTAGKLNAGLDIINAICRAKGISAPIFVDNREAVNEIIPTVSQIINLRVSQDEQLTIL